MPEQSPPTHRTAYAEQTQAPGLLLLSILNPRTRGCTCVQRSDTVDEVASAILMVNPSLLLYFLFSPQTAPGFVKRTTLIALKVKRSHK